MLPFSAIFIAFNPVHDLFKGWLANPQYFYFMKFFCFQLLFTNDLYRSFNFFCGCYYGKHGEQFYQSNFCKLFCKIPVFFCLSPLPRQSFQGVERQQAAANSLDIGFPITVYVWFPKFLKIFFVWAYCRKHVKQCFHLLKLYRRAEFLNSSFIIVSVGFWYPSQSITPFVSLLFCKFKKLQLLGYDRCL